MGGPALSEQQETQQHAEYPFRQLFAALQLMGKQKSWGYEAQPSPSCCSPLPWSWPSSPSINTGKQLVCHQLCLPSNRASVQIS